jgi:HSP20 family protein
MGLFPYDPFRIMDQYWDELDRPTRRAGRGREELSQLLYRVDIEETPTQVIVTADIPGIEKKEDIHIEIDENLLTIHGEVKRITQNEERTSHHSERYYGKFSRAFTLPTVVKADGAHASYKNGVLELTFLKDRHPAARTIEVDFH